MKFKTSAILSFLSVIFLITSTCPLFADSAEVKIVTDFFAQFNNAKILNNLSTQPDGNFSAAGSVQPAVFQHPGDDAKPPTITYNVTTPKLLPGHRLLLSFDTGLRDGIDWGHKPNKPNGVRFSIVINGKELFSHQQKENRWHHHTLDLSYLQNQKLKIDFVVYSNNDNSYDWSGWGSPYLLEFQDSLPITNDKANAGFGILAFQYDPTKPCKVSITGTATKSVKNWEYAPLEDSPTNTQWGVVEFNFPNEQSVIIASEPAVTATKLGFFSHDLVLRYITPSKAMIYPGDKCPIRFKVENVGRGSLPFGAATLAVTDSNDKQIGQTALPQMESGTTFIGEIPWNTAGISPSTLMLSGKLSIGDARLKGAAKEENPRYSAYASATLLPNSKEVLLGQRWLENGKLKLLFEKTSEGINSAKILLKENNEWKQIAYWKPLIRMNLNSTMGPITLEPCFTQVHRGRNATATERYTNSFRFNGYATDPANGKWNFGMTVTMDLNSPQLDINYDWQADTPLSVQSLLGPNIYLGEGSFGDSKIEALFPGLEYLMGAEQSSSTRDFAPNLANRRSPNSQKITIPIMAVSFGENNQQAILNPGKFFCPDSFKEMEQGNGWTIGNQSQKTALLMWDPMQKWDGVHSFPTPIFSSPNTDEGMANHRLALYLPSIPDYLGENQNNALNWKMDKNTHYTLNAHFAVTDGPILTAVRHYLDRTGGLPGAPAWARSKTAERDLCRTGFKTVWDGTNRWSHCVGWPFGQAPGFITAMMNDVLSDSRYKQGSELYEKAYKEFRDKFAQPHLDMIIPQYGVSQLCSTRACHILTWELPFHIGYLQQNMETLAGTVKSLIKSQDKSGGWLYRNDTAQRLGEDGDSVMGIGSNNAFLLMRYARITGDQEALQAGLRALDFIGKFRIPRGGQTWECPMYEPDILPAAQAVRAFVDAYILTGNLYYLDRAVYWAETGVPFVYLWTTPNTPSGKPNKMMLGATIPVFGSTFYSHSWLETPVQWNGLVYSYAILHLIDALETAQVGGKTVPSGLLNFSRADWKRVVDLIISSATWQQATEGENIGTYPDSISNFEKRNPAFINPEDIIVNILAVEGFDPDIKTGFFGNNHAQCKRISTAAKIHSISNTNNELQATLGFYPGREIQAFVSNMEQAPEQVIVNKEALSRSEEVLGTNPGWYYDGATKRLYLCMPNPDGNIETTIK